MSDASIVLSRVSKSFGTTHAVRELDLVVPRGSLCGFLGPNGAGKTTTIRMIMSIIYPDSGSVEVFGGNALRSKDRIGYLPEERGLYRKMRVGDFLHYMARLKGVRRPDLSTYIKDWLDRVELPDVYRKKCEELSKGMQQPASSPSSRPPSTTSQSPRRRARTESGRGSIVPRGKTLLTEQWHTYGFCNITKVQRRCCR